MRFFKRKGNEKGPGPLTTRERQEVHSFPSYDSASSWKSNVVGDKVKIFRRADDTFDVVVYGPQQLVKN